MSTKSEMSPDDTEIAAEFVLRVLPPDAHRAAAVRAASDPAFAAEVRAWENRLIPLTDDIMPEVPRAATKAALMKRLFGVDERKSIWAGAAIWKGLTGLAFSAAAAFAVVAFIPLDPTQPPRFVAELAVAGDTTRMFAVYRPENESLDIAWTSRETTDGRVLQLWGIIEGEAPVSIGVLPPGRTATIPFPAELINQSANLVLALSDEPTGGSPTGQPTGEVVAAAPVSEL